MCGCGCDLAAMLAIERAKAGLDCAADGGSVCTCKSCCCGNERAGDVTMVTVDTSHRPEDRGGWAGIVRTVQGLLLRYASGTGGARIDSHERFEAR